LALLFLSHTEKLESLLGIGQTAASPFVVGPFDLFAPVHFPLLKNFPSSHRSVNAMQC
jgi:hypothetical protein